MTGRLIIAFCVAALLPGGPVGANAPLTSPLPPVRVAMKPPAQQVAGTAQAPLTSPIPIMPKLRLAAAAPAFAPMIGTPSRLAPLRSLVPPKRPAGAEAPIAVVAAAPDPARKPKAGSGGSVCGIPGLKGNQIKPIKAKVKGCGLVDGVEVTSVGGVQLSTPAQIDCPTAQALNNWVQGALVPAVGSAGGGVARLEIAASYVCRPRNNQRGNKISEHGRGRAVDISAITLENGQKISVLDDWGRGKGGRILKSIRKAACGPFTTVLGPGSDPHHRDHLHLDTARGNRLYCH